MRLWRKGAEISAHHNHPGNGIGMQIPRSTAWPGIRTHWVEWSRGICMVSKRSKRIMCRVLRPQLGNISSLKRIMARMQRFQKRARRLFTDWKIEWGSIKIIYFNDRAKEGFFLRRRLETAPPEEAVCCVVSSCSLSPPGQMKSKGL